MKIFLYRTIGVLLISAAVLGLIFSIGGLFSVWKYKDTLTANLVTSVQLTEDTLDATAEALDMIRGAFDSTTGSISSLRSTIITTAQTIDSTQPIMDSLESLADEELPNTISAIQTSLDTAQQSAKVIDSVLKVLTFFNRDAYNPEVPLHEALINISNSLDDMPAAFKDMANNLGTTQQNITQVKTEMESMAAQVEEIEASLESFDKIIDQFDQSVSDVQSRLDKFRNIIDTLVNTGAMILTIFFIWMFIVQLGLITQGWELLIKKDPSKTSE